MIAVAVLRQRPAREIEGTAIRFVRVARRKFYGYQDFEVFGRTVRLVNSGQDHRRLCGPPLPLRWSVRASPHQQSLRMRGQPVRC